MKYRLIPQIKLKFNLTRTTFISPETVINLLISNLKAKEYKISEHTGDSIIFYDNPWRPRYNFERYMALAGGDITITTANGSTLINFNYYLDYFPALFSLVILSIITISDHEYEAPIVFTCFYFITGMISIFRAKWEAKRIVKEVLIEDVVK